MPTVIGGDIRLNRVSRPGSLSTGRTSRTRGVRMGTPHGTVEFRVAADLRTVFRQLDEDYDPDRVVSTVEPIANVGFRRVAPFS